jgi:anthranilate phosphoribosyltransferase
MIEYLKICLQGESLTRQQASEVMELIARGKATMSEMSSLLSSLRTRGEKSEEMIGFAETVLKFSVPLSINRENLSDTCGTGGDGKNTFNISTVVGIVIAAGGLGVAKQGNRSVSSKCGSADVLEELGVSVDLPFEKISECIEKIGFCFLFAPKFHPSFKSIAQVRRELGVKTCFNFLGPLVNPAKVSYQIVGVSDVEMIGVLADSLQILGTREAMVVSAYDGMDEISLACATHVAHLKDGLITKKIIVPEDAGLKRAPLKELKGGSSKINAEIALNILKGEKGPRRDIVLLNAAASFLIAGKAQTLKEGAKLAGDAIDSGKALELIQKLREFR